MIARSYCNETLPKPMEQTIGTDMELDALYTMVAKHFVTMLLLSNYDAITSMSADV